MIVLGSGFPEELIHAFGNTPYWVLGGSLQTGVWAGELAPRDADPVSYCVLKGQIEYDFELERLEMFCGERNIPVFRLETDYNQQDVEQLRIRMEAFSEMLRQRQFQRGMAV